MLSSLIFIFGALGLGSSNSVTALIAWRVIVGIGIGVATVTSPLYIAELAPRHKRGALVSINQLFVTIGILASFIIGYIYSGKQLWREMFYVAAIPASLQFLCMLFFPESPRFNVKKGKEAKALTTLVNLRANENHAKLEIDHIKRNISTKAATWKELFTPKMHSRLIAGLGLTTFQQITGINVIIYYAPTLFKMFGLSSDKAALEASMSIGIVNIIFTILAIYLVDKLGRKPLLYFGISGLTIALFVLGFDLLVFSKGSVASILAICTLFLYIASFAYSLGPIGWLLNSEIYPLHIRGRGMGAAVGVNWLANFISTSTFLSLVALLGESFTFLLYALLGVCALLFVWLYVPETNGKSLEEIEDIFYK